MVVSTFYTGSHSSDPATGNPQRKSPPSPPDTGLLTAFGSYDSHAVVLASGETNTSPKAGAPYPTVTWAAIRGMVESPAARPKEHAQLVVPSSYAACDGRTHSVQRQLGVFHGLAVDIDTGDQSIDAVVAAVNVVTGGARAEVYSSSSSAPDNRKWRVLIPLAAPVAGADYADTQLALFDLLAVHGLTCDVTLSRAAQPVYLPNVPPKKRGSDGQPIFYQYRHVDGQLLELTPDHPIVKERDARRGVAAAERAAAAIRSEEYKSQRLSHVAATGDDFQPIQHFNDHHSVAEMLARYGFKQNERGRSNHWQSPLSTSGSYSTEDRGSHWVTVSNWAHAHNVGKVSANGNRWGDAFDLFAYFEHGGDRRSAARAYADEVRPRDRSRPPVDDGQPVPVEPRPSPTGECRTLDGWRTEAAARRLAVISQPGLHMDRSPTGSGKTHATVEALRQASTSLTVLPTHANVNEHVQDMRAKGIDAVAFPELTPETCQQYDTASRAQSLGMVAGAAVCPWCDFKDSCAYRAGVKAAESAGHRVATHERLRRSSRAADGVQVVVIDESPETVLAPTLTVSVKQLVPVETLAHSIKNHWYSTANTDQKAFAGSMLAVLNAVNATCMDIEAAGTVRVDLPGSQSVPDNWQRLLFDSISAVSIDRRLTPEALTLVTKAATGELVSLNVVTDLTAKGQLMHYVVGSWRPAVPSDASVILLDATGNPDDIAAVVGRPVNDCTPAGHLPLRHPVVQIPDDISRGTSASTVAGQVDAWLAANPDKRVGIIGHKPHMEALMVDGLLGEPARDRVAKWCWFGQGPDRASNDWHQQCDHLLILGTPRTNPGDYRRWLVQHGLHDAAARPGDWGPRDWESCTVDGTATTVRGAGYRDPDWHRAYMAVCRSSLHQSVGRGRAIMPDGIPVTILSNEPTSYVVAPSLTATPAAVRETVEVVRKMGNPDDRPLLTESAKTPIEIPYRENCALGPWQTGDCIRAIMDAAGVDRRAAQVRLRQCRDAGLLVNPKYGWWGLPGAADAPVTAPAPKIPRPASEPPATPPAVITPPVHAVVISATGPTDPVPTVDVVASGDRGTTTTTCTSTVVTQPTDDTLALIDERAAILEYDAGYDRETADRLALEMVLGRGAAAPAAPPDDIVVAVDHVGVAARSEPFVDQVLRRFGGTVKVIDDRHDPFTTGQQGVKERPPGVCCCGHSRWTRIPIHGGQSDRYDCAHCDRFGWFGKWYGKDPARSDPPPTPAPPPALSAAFPSVTGPAGMGLPATGFLVGT